MLKRVKSHQKEGVCVESVAENSPANPSACAGTARCDRGNGYGSDDTDELVARVCNEVQQLRLVGDAEKVCAEL